MWILTLTLSSRKSEPEDYAILTKMFCRLFYAWLYKKQLQQSEFVFADWRCCDKSLVTQNAINFFFIRKVEHLYSYFLSLALLLIAPVITFAIIHGLMS